MTVKMAGQCPRLLADTYVVTPLLLIQTHNYVVTPLLLIQTRILLIDGKQPHIYQTIDQPTKLDLFSFAEAAPVHFFFEGEGGQDNFLGCKNVKNAHEACKKIAILC